MAKILVVDDDEMICTLVARIAKKMGHEAEYALTIREGLAKIHAGSFDIVFQDVRLPDGNGLRVIPEIAASPAAPEIIIITGEGDADGAELAIRSGAWAYIEKPLQVDAIKLPLSRALQYREEKKKQKPLLLKREKIIGDSQPLNDCLNLMAQAANSDAPTLITGETGTGKDLFAQAIHENSRRCDGNFVVVDCAALPANLVESTLFGHMKGAFTGADKETTGLVKIADRGTLFLDEIGELPLAVQGAFLRVLEEHRFRPVGGSREMQSDFRLVAATNRDLPQMAKEGKFRQDLLFRLQAITIRLPPLRERPGDIGPLAFFFMTRFCDRYKTGAKPFSLELLEILATGHDWPGNVREFAHVIENIITTAGAAPVLYPEHLPIAFRVQAARHSVGQPKASGQDEAKENFPLGSLNDFRTRAMLEAEGHYLQNLMAHSRWDIKEACRLAGLSRPRLYALLQQHKIVRPG
ncbi:MAG: Fis family transcriptional regulator [Deltaproteobacteria bacterium RIFOXYD12_FULL_57_12]|nr:MAG: Fis family transcriptional regulator [Deltaproteobacteria bacterium RIFOXYD12_FULL_57_12]